MILDGGNPFESPEFCGLLPFMVHSVPAAGMKMFAPAWRHLLLMTGSLVILTSPSAPTTVELTEQLDEARVGWERGPRETWATIPYDEVTQVRLRGARHKAVIPRVVIESHHWQVHRLEVDYWNNLTLVFGTAGGGRTFDPRKMKLAREMLPRVLPSHIRLRGF